MVTAVEKSGNSTEDQPRTDWYLYIIRCGDGTLYTGITTDVKRRFGEHQTSGPKAAKYLKGRGPLRLMLDFRAGDQETASKLEYRIKRLSKREKEKLIRHPQTMKAIIARINSD